jgi:hypothetical protein
MRALQRLQLFGQAERAGDDDDWHVRSTPRDNTTGGVS